MPIGLSIILCCHNSADRLPQTLAHLSAQRVPEDVRWEVIVIDNASTDQTAMVAQSVWPSNHAANLRVVHEPKLGLSFARTRGVEESAYDFVGFVDDDNWLSPDWVQTALKVLSRNPQIGACGGFIEAIYEATPPSWFELHKGGYAPGAQGQEEGGDVTWRGFLMGAGLLMRKNIWEQIWSLGFRQLLVDRQGSGLTAGGDHEICLAIRLAGWRLWYEPQLHLGHFLPAKRLDWALLRKQARGAGMCEAGLDPYWFTIRDETVSHTTFGRVAQHLKESWLFQILISLGHLARHPLKLAQSKFCLFEGDHQVVWLEREIGRLQGLLERRHSYHANLRSIRRAAWRNTASFQEPLP